MGLALTACFLGSSAIVGTWDLTAIGETSYPDEYSYNAYGDTYTETTSGALTVFDDYTGDLTFDTLRTWSADSDTSSESYSVTVTELSATEFTVDIGSGFGVSLDCSVDGDLMSCTDSDGLSWRFTYAGK